MAATHSGIHGTLGRVCHMQSRWHPNAHNHGLVTAQDKPTPARTKRTFAFVSTSAGWWLWPRPGAACLALRPRWDPIKCIISPHFRCSRSRNRSWSGIHRHSHLKGSERSHRSRGYRICLPRSASGQHDAQRATPLVPISQNIHWEKTIRKENKQEYRQLRSTKTKPIRTGWKT